MDNFSTEEQAYKYLYERAREKAHTPLKTQEIQALLPFISQTIIDSIHHTKVINFNDCMPKVTVPQQ
jgi:hypothetical protein